ncbi:MAG: S1 RNA-binding domain-containing protein [Candidatus Aenigmatarchaeota archaeon]
MVRRKGAPVKGELLVCTASKITPFAAWCKLEEYPHLEGMIHISEAAGKWIYDIREVVKKDKQYVAKVIKVDESKNLVELSLRRVSKKEEKEKMNLYRKEERAEKLLEQAAANINKTLDQAYEEVGFFLQEKFGDLYSFFEEVSKKPKILEELKIGKDWIGSFLKVIESAFKEKEIIIKAELELKSFASDGIERIKKALTELERKCNCEIRYISAPRYRVELKTKDPKTSEKKLKENLEKFIKEIRNLEIEGNYRFVK